MHNQIALCYGFHNNSVGRFEHYIVNARVYNTFMVQPNISAIEFFFLVSHLYQFPDKRTVNKLDY